MDPQRSDPDQIIQACCQGQRSHRGPFFLIHEVMGCGAITPTADAPLLIANSHLLSPYKSLQLPPDQEGLAQGAARGEGGTDLGQ